MKAILLFAFLVLVSPVLSDIWTSCGAATDEFKIGSVVIKPDPPIKGQAITITVTGTLANKVANGTISLDLKFGPITIFNHVEPLCLELLNITCPVPAGAFSRVVAPGPIPASTPSGTYTAHAVFTDTSSGSKEIACINVDVKLTSGSKKE